MPFNTPPLHGFHSLEEVLKADVTPPSAKKGQEFPFLRGSFERAYPCGGGRGGRRFPFLRGSFERLALALTRISPPGFHSLEEVLKVRIPTTMPSAGFCFHSLEEVLKGTIASRRAVSVQGFHSLEEVLKDGG